VPVDSWAQLPQGKCSYLLDGWNQQLAVENPFACVNRTLGNILGITQAVDSLERGNRAMAEEVADFWDSLPTPAREEEGQFLVCSADGKGVPIRAEHSEAAIEMHEAKSGPPPNRKKMSILGTVYSVDPFPRTPEQVMESLFRKPKDKKPDERKRPEPKHKHIRASLERCEQGSTQPAMDEIFGWMAQEADMRDPTEEKPVVILMDGQENLWDAARSCLPRENTTEILDLLHVTPRLWDAASLFWPKNKEEKLKFIKERVLRVLRGEVRSVVSGLRRMASLRRLKGKRRRTLEKICLYLEKNEHKMHYDEYLKQGFPIATGVIEGACRHLVKDRMERSGMRWTLPGAQAMLYLRSVHICGLWDEFTAFRIKKERHRLYPNHNIQEDVPWPIAANA
jgi:hypothetical protein